MTTERSLNAEREEYEALDLLERLESLVEHMDELGVSSRAEAAERVRALHARLDAKS